MPKKKKKKGSKALSSMQYTCTGIIKSITVPSLVYLFTQKNTTRLHKNNPISNRFQSIQSVIRPQIHLVPEKLLHILHASW